MPTFNHRESCLYYEESGSGTPVLLLPGWGGTIAEFTALRDELAKNFRVIAVDLPGSGKSGPQPRTYTPTYYQDDVPGFIALLDSLGATPAHLVGFSDGGEYELLMAALHPETVRSLVTWGAAGSLGTDPQITEMMASVIDNPISPMAGFAEHLKSVYGEEGARIMTKSAASSFRSIIEAGGDISRSRAADMRCPALLITGEHDFLATPALVGELAGAMPQAEFVEAKGASHPVHMEQPEWLVATVTGWLAKQEGR